MTPLDPDFVPSDVDVICSRGRSAYNHQGNVRFRGIIAQHVERYKATATKQQKTSVVNSILEELRVSSRFVRKQEDGKWVEVPEHVAKEKIGQGFRDLLHTEYRSSTKSKVQLRRERRLRKSRVQSGDAVANNTRHAKTNSCETLEPLPLDENDVPGGAPFYDCPFAFVAKDESKIGADNSSADSRGSPDSHQNQREGKSEPKEENEAKAGPREASPTDGPTMVTPKSPSSKMPQGMGRHRHSHSLDSMAPTPGVSPARCPDSWEQYRRPYHPSPLGYGSSYPTTRHYPPTYFSNRPLAHPPHPPTYFGPPIQPGASSLARRSAWESYGYAYSSPPPPPRSYYASPYGSWGSEPSADANLSPPRGHTTRSEYDNQATTPPREQEPSPYPALSRWSGGEKEYRNSYPPHLPYPFPPPPPPPPW